jgi:hypothetical protein
VEDEIIEKGKRINDYPNSSVPAICYKCEMISEKYSLQENNESVNYQDIAPTGERSENSSRKSKSYASVDRSTEGFDHREMKDPKIMEEENHISKM